MMRGAVRSFLLKSILIVALIFAIDRAGGSVMRWLFERSDTPEYARVSYALEKADADIIIIGNSRAVHHYIPSQITNATGMSCYNAGKDGHYIFYHIAILRSILARSKPKVVILEISPWEFEKNSSDDIYPLLPYYDTNTAAYATVNAAGPWEKYKTLSKLYCFNSLPLSVIAYQVLKNNRTDPTHGYVPLYNGWKKPLASDPQEYLPADSGSVEAFDDFLQEATVAGCRVIVCVSPRFYADPQKPFGLGLAKSICRSRSIPFYDFSLDPYWLQHPELFRDLEHLNDAGAQRYTEKVIRILKSSKYDSLTHAF